jgi:hypothetical protein
MLPAALIVSLITQIAGYLHSLPCMTLATINSLHHPVAIVALILFACS